MLELVIIVSHLRTCDRSVRCKNMWTWCLKWELSIIVSNVGLLMNAFDVKSYDFVSTVSNVRTCDDGVWCENLWWWCLVWKLVIPISDVRTGHGVWCKKVVITVSDVRTCNHVEHFSWNVSTAQPGWVYPAGTVCPRSSDSLQRLPDWNKIFTEFLSRVLPCENRVWIHIVK